MPDGDSDKNRDAGERAMRLAMVITELPIMVFVGYILGRSLEREFEGVLLGATVGLILLVVSIWPAFKSRR